MILIEIVIKGLIIAIIAWPLIIVAHEMCHLIACKLLGVKIKSISINVVERSYIDVDENDYRVRYVAIAPLVLSVSLAFMGMFVQDVAIAAVLYAASIANIIAMTDDLKVALGTHYSKLGSKSKALLAIIGVALVGIATVIQMVVDWYQSYAYGIPMPKVIQALVLLAGFLSILAVILSLRSGVRPHA